jgi:Na+/H+ antiporter NhaD/arsenite permease-like protein
MNPSGVDLFSLILFILAILHTFLVSRFQSLAGRFAEGSVGENVFHLLGEVEVVFGIWSVILLGLLALTEGSEASFRYLETRNFNEPIFVFVILVICSTKPVLELAETLVQMIARLIPVRRTIGYFFTVLTVGPILGSLITEPAAMTLVALLLYERFFRKSTSLKLKYATLGVVFVNVSIGGTLTPFAAPPILMVAEKWNWGFQEMVMMFGWKGVVACVLSALMVVVRFRHELIEIDTGTGTGTKSDERFGETPIWVRLVHLVALAGVVFGSHHPVVVVGLFLFFLGFIQVTSEYQSPLRLREGLLVAFFLAGLVVIGGKQTWWLEPLLTRYEALPLYLGAIGLTAITDNAALTYLGSLVPSLSESSRYSLVAGAVVGGGLTVIANAPNPVGYSILQPAFGKEGISSLGLFTSALIPTVIAGLCFWLF